MKRSKMFAGPPILPWFRPDASKPLTVQLAKARIVETVDGFSFPELRLSRLKVRGPAVRKKTKKRKPKKSARKLRRGHQ